MPQLDFDGANSRLSADNIRGQSGSTITIVSGHNLVGSGSGLTALPAANLTGTISAISGVNLTALNATNLASGTVPTARLGSGTANNGVFLRGDGTWAAAGGGVDGIVSSANATAITIDSDENILIGTTNSYVRGMIDIEMPNSTSTSDYLHRVGLRLDSRCGANEIGPSIEFSTSGNAEALIGLKNHSQVGTQQAHMFFRIKSDTSTTTMTEFMRVTPPYYTSFPKPVLFGLSGSTAPKSVGSLEVESTVGQDNGLIVWTSTNNSGAMNMVSFRANSTTEVGAIRSTSSSTSFITSSDYRLKENVVPMTGAIDRIKLFKPLRFNFITNPSKVVDGFLAHEAQEIVPEAVDGTKDEMEEYEATPAEIGEDGNISKEAVMGSRAKMQGIDQAKIVPLLVGALQESITRIESLEQEVATLIG